MGALPWSDCQDLWASPAPPRSEQRKTTHEAPAGATPRDAWGSSVHKGSWAVRNGETGESQSCTHLQEARRGQTRPGPSQGCTVRWVQLGVHCCPHPSQLRPFLLRTHFLAWDLPGRASLSLAHPSFGPDLPKPKRSPALGSCGPLAMSSLTVLVSPIPTLMPTFVQHQEPYGTKLWGADTE